MANITQETYQKYLDYGWSVIPVNFKKGTDGKVNKKPVVSWKEYQNRRPTEEEIKEWSGKYPGIGLVTGNVSNIVALDVDTPNLEKIPFRLSSPIVVQSAFSGGKHFYFKWSEEIRNTAGINNLPLDFRGDGGYIVLPPSNFGGQSYRFEKFTKPMFLEQLPDEIKKNMKKNVIKKRSNRIRSNTLPMVNSGARNSTATQVAGSLVSRLPKTMLEVAGWPALKEWNLTHCNPPLGERELRRTWESVIQTDNRNHPDDFYIYTGKEALDKYKQMESEWGDGLTTTYEEIDNYFTFLPQHIYLLSAVTHTGKTTVTLNIATKMATLYKVLFCSLEMGVFIAPKAKKMLGGDYPHGLNILSSEVLMTPEKLIEVIESMREKPDILFIDHIHFFERTGDNISQEIDRVIINLQNVARTIDLPMVLVAHTRKLNQDRPPRLDDLRDSSSLAQVPSVVVQLYRKENTTDTMLGGGGYLSKQGFMFIQKNRISGKTGALRYTLDEKENLIFQPHSTDKEIMNYLS